MQVAITFTSVRSGNLLSCFDKTFETFRFLEVLKHRVCEMETSKGGMEPSTKHQASLWCAAVLSHIKR